MQVFHNLSDFPRKNNAVVTSGTFDGVHLGHQKILARLQEVAQKSGGESVVITFFPHPRMVVSSDSQSLKMLTTIDEKIDLLSGGIKDIKIDNLIIIPFTREFSEFSSDEYVQNILINAIGTTKMVIGYDHRFGRNRSAGFEYLQANHAKYGIEIEEISRQDIDAMAVSSTKIREFLDQGKVQNAAHLLGRNYSLKGIVVKGRQLGRTIGYPTANIQVQEPYKLIPADGVYVVSVELRNNSYKGMMNIGFRPTVNGIGRTQEVNIFDFDDDIYGEKIKVEFIDYIRPELKFDSIDALKAQLLKDKAMANYLLV